MKKIKVVHVITKLELGGAQGNTLYTVKNLNRERFEVALIAGAGGILDDRAREINDLNLYFVPELVRPVSPIKDLIAAFKLVKIFKIEKPDIIHTHSSKAGILGRLAAKIYNEIFGLKAKIIHTFHGFGFNRYQKAPARFLFVMAEKVAAMISDVLIFVSDSNLSEAKSRKIGDPKRYVLIRSGIDIDFFKSVRVDKVLKKKELKINPDDFVITTVGPFKKQKNLSDFLIVANLLKSKGLKSCFLIVGDGEEREKLNVIRSALNLTNEVRFMGWLKEKREVAEILKITDVFVMTSLWEGLPRSILEAMASSVPVCANAVDGVKDVIKDGDTGLLAEPFDTKHMAENILRILKEEGLRKKITDNALKILDESFDIGKMVIQQENLYMNLYGF